MNVPVNTQLNPDLDLTISRIIKAPVATVWSAWTTPGKFEKWWIPAPALCRVAAMEIKPGGALVTEMSEDGGPFEPHLSACFLDVQEGRRLIFTNALLGGWRPAPTPFMTAIITFADHPEGTDYNALVMHKDKDTRNTHVELGFYDGWGTVAEQLAKLVEK
jgi:uncharacterized protein YndB with AHSA1/START domain